MNEILHLSYGFEVRALGEDARSVDVVASTAAVDSWGEIVTQDWRLDRYKANPVVLYGHNAWDLPIGHASNVRVEDGKLLATLNFVDEKASPMAERVWQGIKQGSLRAVSIGFRSKQATSQTIGDRTVYVLSDNELLEISVVPLPANPEAVMVAEKSMNLIRALAGAQPTQETPMSVSVKSILAFLALSETATEAEVFDKVKSFERRAVDAEAVAKTAGEQVSKVLEATEADTVEKALGAIAAGKSALVELGEAKKQNEQLERAKLIADAKAAKKLTPAQESALEGKSLEFVKGFIELQVPHAVLAAKADEEQTRQTSDLSWKGKTWSELRPGEKHALFLENPDLYKAMRDAAQDDAA